MKRSTVHLRRFLVGAAAVATVLGSSAVAAVPAMATAAAASSEQTWIVSMRSGVDPAAVVEPERRAGRLSTGRVVRLVANATTVRASAATAERLRRDPRVLAVERDQVVRVAGSATWGLDRLDQPALPLNASFVDPRSGQGVTAYVVDSGVNPHAEFGGRLEPGWSGVADGQGTGDCNGHGTHVAGTVAGSTLGVAPGARVVPVRVLDCAGWGSWSTIIAGLDWVAANAVRPAVVNISIQGGVSDAVDAAVKRVTELGLPVVVAAGNQAADACQTSPGRTPEALTVGATTSTDARASFSNYGTCLDLFAPGEAITSASASSPTATEARSGTSMAAPHVAGAVALALQETPSASPTQIVQELLRSASPGVLGGGAGSPDLLAQTNAAPVSRISATCVAATCTLDGSGSTDDRGVARLTWTTDQRRSATVAGPALVLTATKAGDVTATLTVTDGSSVSASAAVTIRCATTRVAGVRLLTCRSV